MQINQIKSYPQSSYPQSGRCVCGHVKFKIMTSPLVVHACHCTWCQRGSGSAFAINAMIESDRLIKTEGELETINMPAADNSWQNVYRCPQCKIALWSHYANTGSAINFVRTGTLENAGLFTPDFHIYVSTKQSWLILPVNTTAFPESYDKTQHWNASSLDRYKRLFENI